MLLDNENEDLKVHEWITEYTEEGKMDIVTGYFTIVEKNKLIELLDRAKEKSNTISTNGNNQTNQILGFLSAVDLLKCHLLLNPIGTDELFYIQVPEENIREIARLFIGDIVQISISENKEGIKCLTDIKRAA